MSGQPAARITDGVSNGRIVTGSSTVLIGSQGGVACSVCPGGIKPVGNPVNPQLGAKVLSGPEDLDFALPGAMPLVWQRQYSSYVNAEQGGYCGIFGYGWGMPLQLRLGVLPTATLMHDSQGRTITFEALAPGQSLYSPSEDIWLLRGGLQAGSLAQESPALGTAHLLEQLQQNPATPEQAQPLHSKAQHMPQWLQGRFAWVHPELARKRHLILAASGQGDALWIFAPTNWQALEAAHHQNSTPPEPSAEWMLIGKMDRLGRQQHYRWQDILGTKRLERITDGSGRIYQLHYQQVCAAQAERSFPHSGKNYRWLADSGVRLTHIDLIADPTRGEQLELAKPITLVRYSYSAQGDLVQVQDRHERTTRRYAWQGHLLVMHQHQSGPTHHYEYDRYAPGGLAVRQRNPGALDYQFDYQNLPAKAGKPRKACLVSDSLGRQKSYIFEGEAGLERLVELHQADASTITYTYNAWGHRSSTTDALGRTTRQQISPTGQLLAAISADGARSSLTYDDDTDLLLASTDAQGRTTRYSYDRYHRLSSVTQADGSSEHYEYPDPQGAAAHALQRINADKPSCIIDAQGGRKHLTYTASGQLASYSDCSGRTTRYTYTRWGQPSTITNALGELTRYHYNEQDELQSVRYPDGSTEHYHYNAQGQLIHIQAQGPDDKSSDTDADVFMAYDEQGRIKERRHAGQALYFAYDAAGRITTLTNENAEHTHFSWDVMDRLVQEVGFDARVQSYQYDAAGQLTAASDGWQQEQDSPAHTQRYEWSTTGLLAARYLPASASTPASVHRYEWNKAAELTSASVWQPTPNAEQLQSQALIERDSAGRVKAEVQRLYLYRSNPNSNSSAEPEIEFEHRIAHRINAMGQRQASSLQGLGDIEFLLYGAGYLHGVSWQGQSLLDIERDALHRETLRQLHTAQHTAQRQLSWDSAGRLQSMRYQGLGIPNTPQAAASHTFGQLHPAEITGQLSARHYHYDSLGQMVGIQTPQGMSAFAYDAAGRLTKATSPHTGPQRWRFDAAGNRLPITDAASALQGTQRSKHQDLIVSPEQLERHDFNAFGEVDAAATDKPQTQHYWAGNRVLHYSNSEDPSCQGLIYSYDYDSRGNRIRSSEIYAQGNDKSSAAQNAMTLDYDSGNQLVQVQLQEQAGATPTQSPRQCTQRYRYDALGRRLAAYRSVQDTQGTTEHSADYFGWDGDRLVHTERYKHSPNSQATPPEIIHTIYEPGTFTPLIQLRRSAKAAPDAVEALIAQAPKGMVQDELRAMLSNLSATQALMTQNMGAGSQAVKELQQLQALQSQQQQERNQSTEVRYYLCDHLGTPNALINQRGEIEWAAQLDAWGQVTKEYNPKALYQPIRLPGQHQDQDTGLYYNRHRYYEPKLGRYINQDPIGLRGGKNLFIYPNSPTSSIDPLGLQNLTLPGMGAGTAEMASLGTHMTMTGASSEAISRTLYGDKSGGFIGSIADKAAEGGQGGLTMGGTIAVGIGGVSGQAGTTTDFTGLTCATTTVCGIVGPILGGSSNAGYAVQTGKVTPGDVSWSIGGVGTWTVGLGGALEMSLGTDGSVGASGGKSMGLLLGGGLQICRQATSTKCTDITP